MILKLLSVAAVFALIVCIGSLFVELPGWMWFLILLFGLKYSEK